MRVLIAALGASLALTACSPATEEPAAGSAQAPIQSSSAPSVGGPPALPTDGGVTPAPDAIEDATADQMAAAVSPAEASARSGGEQGPDAAKQ